MESLQWPFPQESKQAPALSVEEIQNWILSNDFNKQFQVFKKRHLQSNFFLLFLAVTVEEANFGHISQKNKN